MAKDKTWRNIGIIVGVFLIVVFTSLYFTGRFRFSTVDVNTVGEISNCKFVVDGSVCDKYTNCIYDSVNDRSCVKGYEIQGEDLPPSELISPIVVEGGSQ